MVIEQTVEIPANRRLFIEVPLAVPLGRAVLTFTPAEAEQKPRPVFGCAKGQFRMAADFDEPLEDFKDYMQMPAYLLDTHAAIWFFNGDAMLSQTAKRILLDPSNRIHLSIVSAWELAIKISLGKLDFADGAAGFTRLAESNGFMIIPVETAHLTALENLPWIHRDPFDRLLTATALVEHMTFITADKNISRYDVPYVW